MAETHHRESACRLGYSVYHPIQQVKRNCSCKYEKGSKSHVSEKQKPWIKDSSFWQYWTSGSCIDLLDLIFRPSPIWYCQDRNAGLRRSFLPTRRWPGRPIGLINGMFLALMLWGFLATTQIDMLIVLLRSWSNVYSFGGCDILSYISYGILRANVWVSYHYTISRISRNPSCSSIMFPLKPPFRWEMSQHWLITGRFFKLLTSYLPHVSSHPKIGKCPHVWWIKSHVCW